MFFWHVSTQQFLTCFILFFFFFFGGQETFNNIMENLKLAYPKMMDVAVPANLVCGLQDLKAAEVAWAIRTLLDLMGDIVGGASCNVCTLPSYPYGKVVCWKW